MLSWADANGSQFEWSRSLWKILIILIISHPTPFTSGLWIDSAFSRSCIWRLCHRLRCRYFCSLDQLKVCVRVGPLWTFLNPSGWESLLGVAPYFSCLPHALHGFLNTIKISLNLRDLIRFALSFYIYFAINTSVRICIPYLPSFDDYVICGWMAQANLYSFVTGHRCVCTQGAVTNFRKMKIVANATFGIGLIVSPVSV